MSSSSLQCTQYTRIVDWNWIFVMVFFRCDLHIRLVDRVETSMDTLLCWHSICRSFWLSGRFVQLSRVGEEPLTEMDDCTGRIRASDNIFSRIFSKLGCFPTLILYLQRNIPSFSSGGAAEPSLRRWKTPLPFQEPFKDRFRQYKWSRIGISRSMIFLFSPRQKREYEEWRNKLFILTASASWLTGTIPPPHSLISPSCRVGMFAIFFWKPRMLYYIVLKNTYLYTNRRNPENSPFLASER